MTEMARLLLAFEDNTMAVTEPYPRWLAEGALADFGALDDYGQPVPWHNGKIVRVGLLVPVVSS